MTNSDWVSLFRQLPKELHNVLILIAQNRAEIVVDTIHRLEPTFAVIRGRMGGTIESGMLFMMPYDQICSMYVARELKDEEVRKIFENEQADAPATNGKLSQSSQGIAPTQRLSGSVTPGTQPVAEPATVRSNLLERLRAARQAVAPQQNGK
jgi:hypothetical protein